MKRKTILVDIDGVVYNWAKTMCFWLLKNGVLSSTKTIDDWMIKYHSWEIWENWGVSKGEFNRWWRLGIEKGIVYAQGPVIDGARETLWQLSEDEWNIHLITNRLTKFGLHDTIVLNTANWLRDNNIPYRELSFASSKPSVIADAIIDDSSKNMSLFAHSKCFVFPAPHNYSEEREEGFIYLPKNPTSAWKQILETLKTKEVEDNE